RAEVLGAVGFTDRLAQVGVHVVRTHHLQLALLVLVLEQLLPRQFLTAPDDLGETAVTQRDLVLLARLAEETELHLVPAYLYVYVLQRRQAVRAVVTGVTLVAHPDQGGVEEFDERGRHRLAVRSPRRRCQVPRQAPPKPRQRPGERGQAVVLGRVAALTPARVVDVLLTPARAAPCGLDVAGGTGADPDLSPCRRDHQSIDALARALILDQVATRVVVAEPPPPAAPRPAGAVIAAVGQAVAWAVRHVCNGASPAGEK